MYEEPDDPDDQPRPDGARDPAQRAAEMVDAFRMQAEVAAVFEGTRKFDAAIDAGLDPDLARDVQRTIGKLGNGIIKAGPVLAGPAAAEGARLLAVPETAGLSTNDYHVHRRPGEVMVVRWLAGGDQVDTFYDRLQANFDAMLNAHREDHRNAQGWRQDPAATAYQTAIDAVDVDMAQRYRRDAVRAGRATLLWMSTFDEISIAFVCDHVMGVPPAELVGRRSAPPADDPSDADLAWYCKLFALRGPGPDGGERACFFTYLQKTGDTFDE